MFDKILTHFISLEIDIKNLAELKKYIDFCLKNKVSKQKFKTAHHHIIPKSVDCSISDLIINSWNGCYLLHKDHYEAHYLLTKAINNTSILFAFCSMNNKDLKNGRLREEDLIGCDEFNTLMIERNKKMGEIQSKRWLDYHPFSIENSSKEKRDDRAVKMVKARNKVKDSGLTSFQEGAIKGGETRINNGNGTSIAFKGVNTMIKDIDENGMNGLERRSLKSANSKRGKKLIISTCPHCNKTGGGGNMKRYHFDNCKIK